MRYTIPSTALALLTLFFLTTTILAATPTSFCKCTCFKKSMIIPLDAPTVSKAKLAVRRLVLDGDDGGLRSVDLQSLMNRRDGKEEEKDDASNGEDGDEDEGEEKEKPPSKKPYKQKTCSDCNKSFCLDLGLPDCKDATEEDVQTSCFQRDSSKDEAVVFIFIIATLSLLAWALAKPWVGKWMEQAKERRSYIAVSGSQN